MVGYAVVVVAVLASVLAKGKRDCSATGSQQMESIVAAVNVDMDRPSDCSQLIVVPQLLEH